jgi:hypothetical protein
MALRVEEDPRSTKTGRSILNGYLIEGVIVTEQNAVNPRSDE